jgi:hypothetical protein
MGGSDSTGAGPRASHGKALVLGAAKSFESGNSKNWHAEVVDKEKFVAACTFN